MFAISHAPRQPVKELLHSLHANFGQNMNALGQEYDSQLDSIDLNSRIISEIRTIASENYCNTDAQKKICSEILDEVFTDFSLAMYLSTIGLIVPARMSARRAVELGLASVYMWDLPHEYWGWRQRDQDLSFSAMVAHLNSVGYLEYIRQVHGLESSSAICDQGKFQVFYRELSNTVHGKITGLPPLSPDRFSPDKNGLQNHLQLIRNTQAAIIQLLFGRFPDLESRIEQAFPQIKRT